MSLATPTTEAIAIPARSLRPSFWGLVRGELFKVRLQRATWVMLALLIVVMILPYLLLLSTSSISEQIHNDTSNFFYDLVEIGPTVLRVFSGFFLLIITARMIGLEYRLGTIRLLLARGVGRMQLLCAKVVAAALIGLALLIVGLLLTALMSLIVVVISSGNLDAFQAFPAQLWTDAAIFVLTLLVNTGVTILLATVLAVIGRSSVFGLAAALAFFPLDNIGTEIMQLAYLLTHNDLWLNLTAYFLGPNLNVMAHALVEKFAVLGASPLYFMAGPAGPEQTIQNGATLVTHGTLVDGTHTLVVAGVYAAIFLIVSLWLTQKRDVQE